MVVIAEEDVGRASVSAGQHVVVNVCRVNVGVVIVVVVGVGLCSGEILARRERLSAAGSEVDDLVWVEERTLQVGSLAGLLLLLGLLSWQRRGGWGWRVLWDRSWAWRERECWQRSRR